MAYGDAGLTDFKKQGMTADRVWYVKQAPAGRADGGRGDVDCAREVIAAKLYQYLLGDSASPDCKLVTLGGELTVASQYFDSSEITDVVQTILGAREETRDDIANLIKIFTAAYLLGEADLNVQSIRVNTETGKFMKIDHDRALMPGIHSLGSKPGVKNILDVYADYEAILSWCGYKDSDIGGALKKYIAQSVVDLNAAAQEVFEKFAALTPAKIAGFIAEAVKDAPESCSAGIAELSSYLNSRVDEAKVLWGEKAPDAAVAGSPLLSPVASPMMSTVRTTRSDSSPQLSYSAGSEGGSASSGRASVVPCASPLPVVGTFYSASEGTGAPCVTKVPAAAGASPQ